MTAIDLLCTQVVGIGVAFFVACYELWSKFQVFIWGCLQLIYILQRVFAFKKASTDGLEDFFISFGLGDLSYRIFGGLKALWVMVSTYPLPKLPSPRIEVE